MAAESTATSDYSTKKNSWHWSCSSCFCKNSWRTEGMTYYTLTWLEKATKNARDAYLHVIGKSKVNWKREVICCAHWSSGQRLSLDDLPDVKHTFKDDTLAINWHWNCAAALCTNSWRTPGIHYYKLCEIARDKDLKCTYEKVLKNKNVNWKRNVICSERWSKGKRLSIEDIPDRSTSSSYIQKKTSFITPPRKIESAKRCLKYEGDLGVCKAPSREIKRSVYSDPKDEIIKSITSENSTLKAQLLEVQRKLQEKEGELSKLTEEVATLNQKRFVSPLRVDTAKGRPKPEICTAGKHKLWSQCLSADHPLKEHNYCKGQVDIWSLNVEHSILNELLQLHCRVKELEEENEKLRSKCLLLEDLKLDDKKFQFWTGFPNYGTFKALFDYLESVGALGRLRHWRGCEMFSKNRAPVNKVTRTTKLTPEELFMVLVRLRVGLTVTDLALRFGISESSLSKIFTSWINLLYFHLKDLCEMPESETDGKARQFSKFPYLRVIIDYTEIFTQKPSSLQANKKIYSNYKGYTTFKFLVGIDPHGAIVYVSQAWGGRTSDKHITANSPGLTTKLNMGDELMADRGFAVEAV
ncbi:hypothetical protein ACROYT_G015575 [Oculina patagonica]